MLEKSAQKLSFRPFFRHFSDMAHSKAKRPGQMVRGLTALLGKPQLTPLFQPKMGAWRPDHVISVVCMKSAFQSVCRQTATKHAANPLR